MHRTEILDEAKRLTTGDRLKSYGSPYKNHADIAAGWSVILGKPITPAEVALCMAWLKIARTVKDPKLNDSYVDGAAYMAIAGELMDGDPSAKFNSLPPEVYVDAHSVMAFDTRSSPAVWIMDPENEAA